MKLHRFIGDFDFSHSILRVTERDFVEQVISVLRLARGEELILCDGKRNEVRGKILTYEKGFVEIEILEKKRNEAESECEVTLYLSILKKSNFELAAQKATEAGVTHLTPVLSTRTVKLNMPEARISQIMKEASEQSGRGVVPQIHKAIDFDMALEHAKQNDANLLFDSSGNSMHHILPTLQDARRIGIFIGPEGGFDPEEVSRAKEKGFKIGNLGKRTLRAETAATIATFIICQLHEE
ncbi:MAG: RsmE family RNA methyltransferase [Candidatus Paceibacterota bacterium]|jgi:16S rRNA (uracil1498-N3)-methyltransferase